LPIQVKLTQNQQNNMPYRHKHSMITANSSVEVLKFNY